MEYFKEIEERVILVGVQMNDGEDTEESLEELSELAKTAGAQTVGTIIQNREAVHPGTYIGKGKIEEVRSLVLAMDANGVICDDELSPAQLNNLERELDCKVMDRTLLILDIFARRAVTSEGKIQVELAQLRYRSARLVGLRESLSRLGGGIGTRGPGEKKLETDRRLIRTRISALKEELKQVRLVGLRESLSRLGGGIGTRGPGEKKLETDRRLIRTRISALKEELKQVEKHRELIRGKRAKGNLKTAAIVGYTNAGKSTLLNVLTGAEVLSEDKLFATLDPTTRLLELSDGQQILLTDTVGFIRKLPHHLVEAFKSTLEEAKYADYIVHVVDSSNPQAEKQMHIVYVGFIRKLPHHLVEAFKSTLEEAKYADYIVHVVDSSNPQAEKQMHIVYETLRELGAVGKPVITLFNKQDKTETEQIRDLKADHTLKISAKTGEGLEEFKELLGELLSEGMIYVERVFPYQEAGKIQLIRERGQLLSEEYTEAGIAVTARVPKEIYAYVI